LAAQTASPPAHTTAERVKTAERTAACSSWACWQRRQHHCQRLHAAADMQQLSFPALAEVAYCALCRSCGSVLQAVAVDCSMCFFW
jgi:hypothetical protein